MPPIFPSELRNIEFYEEIMLSLLVAPAEGGLLTHFFR